jgi:hypothetical protein
MKRNRVNVLTVVNSASNISTEIINGREHIVVRGVTPVVDDIVMNGKLYPAAEIEKGYRTLERNPMPLGHPKVNGKHISARDVQAVNEYHVGAWLQDVQHVDGKVSADMYVDKRYAEGTEKGPRLLNRLDEMAENKNVEPIHISTGLLYSGIAANGQSKGKKYREIVTNMLFDHTAILLDENGAGTPQEGVGIFVNAEDGAELEIEIANLADASDCTREGLLNKTRFFFTNASNYSFEDIRTAICDTLRAGRSDDLWLYPEIVWPDTFIYQEGSRFFKQKYIIDDNGKAVFVGEPAEVVRKPTEWDEVTNGETNTMKDKMLAALNGAGVKTEGLNDDQVWEAYNQFMKTESEKPPTIPVVNADAISLAVNEALKPLNEKLTSLEGRLLANSEKEITEKREVVKEAFNMSDEEVADLTGKALDGFYAKCQTTTGLNGAYRHVNNSETFTDMPE